MRTISIIQLGFGGVGRALARQIVSLREWHKVRYGVRLRYVALCDSDGAIVDTDGIQDDVILDALERKKAGEGLKETPYGYSQSDVAAIVDVAGTDETVVVDVSASEETLSALLLAVQRGYGIVTANKKPLTDSVENYRKLKSARFIRYESTVGSGLPVIATLHRLLRSGDKVCKIEGALSGTLGYLMTQLQKGVAFSEAVREAYRLGYTEPDPRDDLGGVDVARKALILARDLGYSLSMEDISLEPLYPQHLDELSVSEFLDVIEASDERFKERVLEAKAKGEVLRYAASVTPEGVRVGLESVPESSPLGQLKGNDNLISFYTSYYDQTPLVIQGRGAGVDATASGVLADIMEF
jgi:homoserine dehydrogenase